MSFVEEVSLTLIHVAIEKRGRCQNDFSDFRLTLKVWGHRGTGCGSWGEELSPVRLGLRTKCPSDNRHTGAKDGGGVEGCRPENITEAIKSDDCSGEENTKINAETQGPKKCPERE